MKSSRILVLPIVALLSASAGCGGTSSVDGLGGTSGTSGTGGGGTGGGGTGGGGTGGTGGSSGGTNGITLAELPPLYAQAVCENQRACLGELLSILLPGESCETNAETGIRDELPRIEQAIAAGKVRYDGTKIQACLDKIGSIGCTNAPEPAECTAAIDGTVATGGECSMSVECAGGENYCKTDASCPGRCAPREAAGGPCNRSSNCAEGLNCSDQTQRCFAPARLGEACGAGSPECGGASFCVGENEGTGQPGVCRSLQDAFSATSGQPCLMGAPFCQPSLRCVIDSFDSTTGTATTRCAQPVASGAACQLAFPDVCPGDQYCAVASGTLRGTCTAKPGNGQPCVQRTADEDPTCAPNTRCDAGTCRTLQRLGGSCQTDDVCYSGDCIGNGCAPSGACE